MVSTYTFDEHMLDIHRRYAPSPDAQSPEAPSASSMTSTVPMIPGGLTFEEYLLVAQQQNSQGFWPPQVLVNPPHHYDVVGNPVYSFPVNPYQTLTHLGPLLQGQLSGLQGQPFQGQPLVQQGKPSGPQGQPYSLQGQPLQGQPLTQK